MAQYCSTLVIEGNLGVSDAQLLSLLELDRPRNIYDKHKIGKENATYEEALALDHSNDVFVSSYQNFTIIVSRILINDFSGSIGLTQNKIEQLFPDQRYFFFFSNSTSMLHALFYAKGKTIIRKKIVTDGKYLKVLDHEMDMGEMFPEELALYTDGKELKEGYPSDNRSYMYGVHDFNIGLYLVERLFFKKPADPIFFGLVFNRNINAELSDDYIQLVNNKLTHAEANHSIKELIKPLIKQFKLKKIDFKSPSDFQKKKGYYRRLNESDIIVLEAEAYENFGILNIGITLKVSTDLIKSQKDKFLFYNADWGISLFTLGYFDLTQSSLKNKNDLKAYLQSAQETLPELQRIIGVIVDQGLMNLLKDSNYFTYGLQRIERYCSAQKFDIGPTAFLNYCTLVSVFDSSQKDIFLKVLTQQYHEENTNQNKAKIESQIGKIKGFLSNV